MIKLRSNDCATASEYSRSDRIFHDPDAGLWYFRTREGNNIGPFRYRSEAEEMLTRFLSALQKASCEAASVSKLRFRIANVPRDLDAGAGYSASPGL